MTETRTPVVLHEPMHMHPAAVETAARQFALTGKPVEHPARGREALAIAGLAGRDRRDDEPFVRVGSTAVITVDGPVMSGGGCWWWCGTSLYGLVAALDAAADDSSIEAAALDLDTPGGTVAGMTELVAAIDRLVAVKPVHAFVHEMACSLGYLMAARCTKVWATPSSTSGSIGSIYAVEDSAEATAKHGLRVHYITSGAPHKKTNRYGAAADDEMLAHWQTQIDSMGSQFRAMVAERRPLTDVEMLAMGGAAYYGESQVGLKLVDQLIGAREFYALAADGSLAGTEASPAPTPPTPPTPSTPSTPPAAPRGATQEAVMASVDELKEQYNEMTDEDKEAFRNAIADDEQPENETDDTDEAGSTAADDDGAGSQTDEDTQPGSSAAAPRVSIEQAEATLKKHKLPEHTVNALALKSQKEGWDKTDLLEAALEAQASAGSAPSGQPAPIGGGRAGKGGGSGGGVARFNAAVKACMDTHQIPKAQATARVSREQPELHQSMLDEVNAGRVG
jgi:ClpP class serine protease